MSLNFLLGLGLKVSSNPTSFDNVVDMKVNEAAAQSTSATTLPSLRGVDSQTENNTNNNTDNNVDIPMEN